MERFFRTVEVFSGFRSFWHRCGWWWCMQKFSGIFLVQIYNRWWNFHEDPIRRFYV